MREVTLEKVLRETEIADSILRQTIIQTHMPKNR
jgi:hypothetical protein